MKVKAYGAGIKRAAVAFTVGLVSLSMMGFTPAAVAAPALEDHGSGVEPAPVSFESGNSEDTRTLTDEENGLDSSVPEAAVFEGGQSEAEGLMGEQSGQSGADQSGNDDGEDGEGAPEQSTSGPSLEAPRMQAFAALEGTASLTNFCTAPGTYSLTTTSTTSRQMVLFPVSGADSSAVGTFTTAAASNTLNGLAVMPDGTAAYAVERNGNTYRIHKMTPDGTVTIPTSQAVTMNAGPAMVGAINPAGTIYYFGHFTRESGTSNRAVRLQLFAYNVATNTWIGQVGYVAVGTASAAAVETGTDGDIAFDANGNLLILWGSAAIAVDSRLYRLPAANVPTTASTGATAAATALSTTITTPVNSAGWNGLAFDDAGNLWMQRLSSTDVVRQQIDPSSGALIGNTTTVGGIAGNDLAGCFQTVPKVSAASWPLNNPTNSGMAGSGAIPTVTSSVSPAGITDSGTTRTFTVTYSAAGSAVRNARLWHQYMVEHDHQTTYSVTCTRTGTATCPTVGTNGMPPASGLVLNGEASSYYNTFWAIANIPANSSLTFTIRVTTRLADSADACSADPTVMVGGWARFSQAGFVVPTNVQASASNVGQIRATQCPNGVVAMTNAVTAPGPAANPNRVLSGDARVFTATWENTSGSSVTLPLWYSYYVPYQGNVTEASWTCTSAGGGGAGCPSVFPPTGTATITSDGTETAETVFGSDPNNSATFVTLAAGQKLTFTITLTTTLHNCTQDGFYPVQTYAKRGTVSGDPNPVRTVASSQLVEIGCSTWMVNESFSGTSVVDTSWRGLDKACLTKSTSTATPPVLGKCNSTTGVPTPSFTPAEGQAPGYLQLTDDQTNQVGAILYDRAIPAKNGLVVEFTQYQFGTGTLPDGAADGIGFFLADGAYPLTQTGAGGGGLGYANKPIQSGYPDGIPGLPHGYFGVGFDVYGNFAATSNDIATQCSTGTGVRVTDSITLRGPGNGAQGYCAVGATQTVASVESSATLRAQRSGTRNVNLQTALTASKRKTRVTVYALEKDQTAPRVTVEMDFGAGYYVMVLDRMMTAPAPDLIKFGFLGSTGGSRDAHLLGDVRVGTVLPMSDLNLVKSVDRRDGTGTNKQTFSEGDQIPYQFVMNNTGAGTIYQIQVTDPKIANVSCPATQLNAGGQVICTGTYTVTKADRDAGHFSNTATARASISATDARNLSSTASVDVPINPTAPDDSRIILPSSAQNPTSAVFQILSKGTVDGIVEPDDPTKVEIRLVNPSTGQPTDAKTLNVANQGTWTLDANNTITFKPIDGYMGVVTPLKYEARSKVVVDGIAGSAQGTLSVTLSVAPLRVCTAAQQRASGRYWAFGTSVKLDFGITGTTVPTSDVMSLVASPAQGTFTVTDAQGNLQFVVDSGSGSGSGKILNKDGQSMTIGGTGPDSGNQISIPVGTGASPVTVFPAGQGTGKYFVVTSSATATSAGQLTYRVIDMSLNGGKGGLSGAASTNLGGSTASMAVTSVPNANGTGYWVVNIIRGTNQIIAYPFNAAGPSGSGVTTTTSGTVVNPGTNEGYEDVRFSSDLTQVATISSNATVVPITYIRLLAFNASTGTLTASSDTKPVVATSNSNSLGYSVDFSVGDSPYVYSSFVARSGLSGSYYAVQRATTGSPGNRTLGTFAAVGSTQTSGGAIRRGADGRLYWAKNGQASLSYLPDPNGTGTTWSSLSLTPTVLLQSGLALSNTLSDCAISSRGFAVEKYGQDGTRIDGAEFKLFPNNPATDQAADTAVSPGFQQVEGETGKFTISGLDNGVFWLRETKAPPGYNLLAKDVRVNITVDGTVTTPATPATPQVQLVKNADGTFTFKITDTRAVALPFAGGQDSKLLLIGGGTALALALLGAMWWRRRTLHTSRTAVDHHANAKKKGPRHAQGR